ncbi:MAG: integrase zinc binding domain-containing protein, partial [bacterium]
MRSKSSVSTSNTFLPGFPVVPSRHRPAGGSFLLCCGMLYHRGQGEADRSCVPEGGHIRRDILRECHDTPLGVHFGRHENAMLMLRLTFLPGHRVYVYSCIRTCDTCQ